MHELLAPLIYLLDQEKMTPTEGSTLSTLLDKNHIEGDAYILFERIMKSTASWFISKPKETKSTDDKEAKKNNISPNAPILVKCQHIHTLLKNKDPALYLYISSLKIEPQVFLLRWIRLLFGREFKLDQTLTLWDAIFAYDKTFALIDYISVSMLMNIREKVLSSDQNDVLQLLFKYPTGVPINTYVLHALEMAKAPKRSTKPQQLSQHASVPIAIPKNGVDGAVGGHQGGVVFPKALGAGLSGLGLLGNHVVQHSASDAELVQVKCLHNNVAVRLENIVSILQTNLMSNAKQNLVPDTVLLAVAELKQIKDVMCGNLPLEALPSIQPDPNSQLFN